MSIMDLKNMVQSYLDKLEYIHPFVNSDKFTTNSYSKWACKELLNEIGKLDDLPFHLTPVEFLDAFTDKMKTYAYMNSKNSLPFVIAAETAEYFIEECFRHK